MFVVRGTLEIGHFQKIINLFKNILEYLRS